MKLVELQETLLNPLEKECTCQSIPADFKNINEDVRSQLAGMYGDYIKWFKRDGAGAIVTHDPLTINLVTKLHYYDRATYDSMNIALKQAADMCYGLGIFELSMAKRKVCDGLRWVDVRKLIEKNFADLDMLITVYED